MFEDILDYKESKDNLIVVCANCGVKMIEIINDITNENFIVDTHEHLCTDCWEDLKQSVPSI